MDSLMQLQFYTFQRILLFDYLNTIIVGNDTELIKLRDMVKTEKVFELKGKEENILISI